MPSSPLWMLPWKWVHFETGSPESAPHLLCECWKHVGRRQSNIMETMLRHYTVMASWQSHRSATEQSTMTEAKIDSHCMHSQLLANCDCGTIHEMSQCLQLGYTTEVRYCVYRQAWDTSCSVSTVTWISWALVHPNGYWWAPLKWGTLSPLLQTSCRQTEVILWSRRTGQCTREPAPAPWNKPLIKLHGCLLQLGPQSCQVGEVPACERRKKGYVAICIYTPFWQHVTLPLSILHSTLSVRYHSSSLNGIKLQNCYYILIKQNKCTSSIQPHEQPTWAAVSHVPI